MKADERTAMFWTAERRGEELKGGINARDRDSLARTDAVDVDKLPASKTNPTSTSPSAIRPQQPPPSNHQTPAPATST